MNANAPMNIRQVGSAHAEVLAALHETSFEQPWSAAEFARLLETPGTISLLAILEGQKPVAMILFRGTSGEAEILTLAVHPDHRRTALGTTLVEAAVEQLRGSADNLFLEVAQSNSAACALYSALGFVEVGRRTGYYLISGTRQDALVMRLDLV